MKFANRNCDKRISPVIWLTGLPSSGKTTTAKYLKSKLSNMALRVEIIDGDDLRLTFSPQLGFSRSDREKQAKRAAEIGRNLSDRGIIPIVALISPYRSSRENARSLIGSFVEVWVKCSVETCIKRDPKGLYKKALQGKVTDLTGIHHPYESPLDPELIINTETESPGQCANRIVKYLAATDLL